MASLDNFRLVVFRAVAERLSFRKAGEDLYLTQPAVSLQIKALEEDLGVQLFDRTGRQIALTPAGVILLDYAQQVHGLLDQAERQIAALNGEHAGALALGASTTIAQYVLPRLLAEFRREHPRIHITLISGNTGQIVVAVEEQRIAMGFIEGPAHSRDVSTEAFLEDELVLIVSTANEWTERASIACSEITAVPLLMRERGSGTRQVIEMALERRGIKPNAMQIVMERFALGHRARPAPGQRLQDCRNRGTAHPKEFLDDLRQGSGAERTGPGISQVSLCARRCEESLRTAQASRNFVDR
jgi:DNA-binding transcriptional LysR family regulator